MFTSRLWKFDYIVFFAIVFWSLVVFVGAEFIQLFRMNKYAIQFSQIMLYFFAKEIHYSEKLHLVL